MVCNVEFLNVSKLICLYTVKWFQVLLYNPNNSISQMFLSLENDYIFSVDP